MDKSCPGSILKHSGPKMLTLPIFLELGTDEKKDLDKNAVTPFGSTKTVRFKDSKDTDDLEIKAELLAEHHSDEDGQ